MILFSAVIVFLGKTEAQTVIATGNCGANGNNLTWILTNNGTLTISGSGAMEDYSSSYPQWKQLFEDIIKTVVIGDSVTTIGVYAFTLLPQLTSVVIGNSVASIGKGAINRCPNLQSVTIPKNVSYIDEQSAFWACDNLKFFEVDSDNLYYASENGVFFNKIKTILFQYPAGKTDINYSVPNGVETIYGDAFFRCYNLTSVTISKSVTTMGFVIGCAGYPVIVSVFRGCYNLTSINVESDNMNFTSENGILFDKEKTMLLQYPAGMTDTTYNIPNSVTTIGWGAFEDCSYLTSMIIPNTITVIETYAFTGSGLISITISGSVTMIGPNAFIYCRSLLSITLLNLVPNSIYLGMGVFMNEGSFWNQGMCNLIVPSSAVSAYQSTEVWQEFNIVGGGILVNTVSNYSVCGYTEGNKMYNTNATAMVSASARNGFKFVNWTKEGIEISTDSLYSFTVTEDIELVANFFEDIEVGITETTSPSDLVKLYPNPVSTTLYIEIGNVKKNSEVKIYSIQGALLVNTKGNEIDVSSLPSGIYIVEVNGVCKKLVKQ